MLIYLYAFIALLAVLVGHILGISGLYMAWGPYDILMHIAGGFGIGLFACAFLRRNWHGIIQKRGLVVLGALVFGIVWELFEIRYNIAGYKLWTEPYYIDTAKDLVDDIIGGIIAARLFIK